jgi:hypothetical protein
MIPLPEDTSKGGSHGALDPPTDHLAGLDLHDADAFLLQRWPHLRRAGPQKCNQIAATYEQALRRMQRPRSRMPTRLAVVLRTARLIVRIVRREVEPLAREVLRLRRDLDRLSARRAT